MTLHAIRTAAVFLLAVAIRGDDTRTERLRLDGDNTLRRPRALDSKLDATYPESALDDLGQVFAKSSHPAMSRTDAISSKISNSVSDLSKTINSIIYNSHITRSDVFDSTVLNSSLEDSTCDQSTITNSVMKQSVAMNATLFNSSILGNSRVQNSELTNSNVAGRSVAVGSKLTNSGMTNSRIQNCVLVNSHINRQNLNSVVMINNKIISRN